MPANVALDAVLAHSAVALLSAIERDPAARKALHALLAALLAHVARAETVCAAIPQENSHERAESTPDRSKPVALTEARHEPA
jgi:hypothetical protein